jgi:hypothetical protein
MKRKSSKHAPWWARAAADSVRENFGERLDRLPQHELDLVMGAAHHAAIQDRDWSIVKIAAFNALTKARAIVDDATETTWRDKTDRHPEDTRLRRAGYTIKSRPEKGEAIWKHRGNGIESITHSEALAKLKKKS